MGMVLDANLTGLQGMAQEMAIGQILKWIGVEEVLCNPMIMIVGLVTDLQEMVIGQILSIDLEMVLDVNLTGLQGMDLVIDHLVMDQTLSIGLEMALDPQEMVTGQGDQIGVKKVVVGVDKKLEVVGMIKGQEERILLLPGDLEVDGDFGCRAITRYKVVSV